jgi:hypothetical protein
MADDELLSSQQGLYLSPTFNPPGKPLSDFEFVKVLYKLGYDTDQRNVILGTKKAWIETQKTKFQSKTAPSSNQAPAVAHESEMNLFEGNLVFQPKPREPITKEKIKEKEKEDKSKDLDVSMLKSSSEASKTGFNIMEEFQKMKKRREAEAKNTEQTLPESKKLKSGHNSQEPNALKHLMQNSLQQSEYFNAKMAELKARQQQQQPLSNTTSSSLQEKTNSIGVLHPRRTEYTDELSRLTEMDFLGLDRLCRTEVDLKSLFDQCKKSKTVQISLILKDCTTNHFPTSIKRCKGSAPCHLWHCACDKTVRTEFFRSSPSSLIGILFIVGNNIFDSYLLPMVSQSEVGHSSSSLNLFSKNTRAKILENTDFLFRLLSDSSIMKVLYDSQVSMIALCHLFQTNSFPTPIVKNLFDPKIAAYLINSDVTEENLELYQLLNQYRIFAPPKHYFFGEKDPNFNEKDLQNLGRFSEQVVLELLNQGMLLMQLTGVLERLLLQNSGVLFELFQKIEMPVNNILSFMEYNGIIIDVQLMGETRKLVQEHIKKTEETVHMATRFRFNLSSPEQVSEILFDKLKIDPGNIKKGTKGLYSTAEKELMTIIDKHPAISEILKYRSLTQLQNSYLQGFHSFILEKKSNHQLGTIHAYWNQTIVRTGRLSCAKPNLQSISGNQKIDDQEYKIRQFFRPSEG